MTNSFGSFCDDFFVEMCVNTQLDLPTQRDTVLSFFERIQKQYPQLSSFSRRETGEYSLEQEEQGQRTRWVSLELDRITVGWAEPHKLHDAYAFQTAVLELIPYMLGVSVLDMDSLDVTFSMDFDYQGNHDEVIVEVPESADYKTAAEGISTCMIHAMRRVCPDVEIRTEYAVMRRWRKGASAVYDEEGRLIAVKDG